jgi:hypothetical protein
VVRCVGVRCACIVKVCGRNTKYSLVPKNQLNGNAKQGGNTPATRPMQIRSCDVQQNM